LEKEFIEIVLKVFFAFFRRNSTQLEFITPAYVHSNTRNPLNLEVQIDGMNLQLPKDAPTDFTYVANPDVQNIGPLFAIVKLACLFVYLFYYCLIKKTG